MSRTTKIAKLIFSEQIDVQEGDNMTCVREYYDMQAKLEFTKKDKCEVIGVMDDGSIYVKDGLGTAIKIYEGIQTDLMGKKFFKIAYQLTEDGSYQMVK